jgi:hypothetical protein
MNQLKVSELKQNPTACSMLDRYIGKSLLSEKRRLINISLYSELFQRQRTELLSKLLLGNHSNESDAYICVGGVKATQSSVMYHYLLRERYFRHRVEQRRKLSMQLSEINIKNLSVFSIVYALLSVHHQSEIGSLKCVESSERGDQDESDEEENERRESSEPSSFILYNCARLNALIDKYERLKDEGAYGRRSSDQFDFAALLTHEMEKKLCEKFLFEYDTLMDDIRKSITLDEENVSSLVNLRVNVNKLCRFLIELSTTFSKYYSKVHVIEEPRFEHLHERMHARFCMLRAIQAVYRLALAQIGISSIRRL